MRVVDGSRDPSNRAVVRPGHVSRGIFSDSTVFERELQRIFGRCWLFLGHEALIPEPGDYLTTYLGADPVIVCRSESGKVRAFLNSCPHRGNRVCLFDVGNTSTFRCSYHGWSFDTNGNLVGVPFIREAYFDGIDREGLGLVPVPRVEVCAGLVFGSWAAEGSTLEQYLGNMAFYLSHFLGAGDYGGLTPVGGRHAYTLRANWKIIAENNVGDHYHTMTTHGSVYRVGIRAKSQGFEGEQSPFGPFEIRLDNGHGIGGIETDDEAYERELRQAEALGGLAVEWVKERYRRFGAAVASRASRPYSYSHATVFPNFSFFGRGAALNGRLLSVLHPRTATETEVWYWFLMERDAPEVVKEYAWTKLGGEGLLASGIFAQDDAENFERVTESTRSPVAREHPFDLSMGLAVEEHWPGQETWKVQGLPGVVGPRFSEHNQRGFYEQWDSMMNRGAGTSE